MAILLLAAGTAAAHTTETITSFAITNYTGYVIDSDAGNMDAAFNRDAIRTLTTVNYATTNDMDTPVTFYYELRYSLLDDSGGAVPIYSEGGGVDTVYTVADEVTLPSAISSNVTVNYQAAIKPAARLDPYQQHTVRVDLYQRPSTIDPFTATGDVDTDGPHTYYHFTNMVSEDAAANVIAVLDNSAYARTYLVDTVPNKDTFQVDVDFDLYRYDRFDTPVPIIFSNIAVHIDFELKEATSGTPVALVATSAVFAASMHNHGVNLPPLAPGIQSFTETVDIQPAGQLDSIGDEYQLVVTIRHVEASGQPPVTGNAQALADQRLLHFNGSLFFNDIETRFTSIANIPPVNAIHEDGIESVLAVDNGSGYVVGKTNHTYGVGAPLDVVLRANGNAEVTLGSVSVSGPVPDDDVAANIHFTRTGGITLNIFGGFSNVRLTMPTGFGFTSVPGRILDTAMDFVNLRLNQALAPATNPVYLTPMFACEESKPLWFFSNPTTWDVAAGQIQLTGPGVAYVRRDEFTELAAAPVDSSLKYKRSNAQYFRFLEGFGNSDPVVTADGSGLAQLTVDLVFTNGLMVTHFPYDSGIVFTGGVMNVVNDQVVTASSALSGAAGVIIEHARDCPASTCAGPTGPEVVYMEPDDDTLAFTIDGGLTSPGSLPTPTPLRWGWISSMATNTHQTTTFTEAAYHMPGVFLPGTENGLAQAHAASVLLLSGTGPKERPGTSDYTNGFGDYAGMNFRVGSDGAKQADSVLAGQPTGLYPLTGRSKYYTRFAGVNGIHEAVFGSFPPTAYLYGYEVNFDNFGLAYLDLVNVDSRTEGYIHIVLPSNFDQNFEELTFTCVGGLDNAKIPGDETDLIKTLEYWAADFRTLAIDFITPLGCDPSVGYLVLAVETHAQHVGDPPTPLHGILGFKANGNLLTHSDGIQGVDSRLSLPNQFTIEGPGDEAYTLMPVNDAYLNNWEVDPGDGGYINIAGTMDVPFFEDLQVHLHTSANTNTTTAPIYLMGGWAAGKGFAPGGNHFFDTDPADPSNLGKPGATPDVMDYRLGLSGDDDTYRVRAVRNWLGVVDLDYPLDWSSSTRAFTGFESVHNDLLVLRVEHEAKYVSAENVELAFGAQYDGLPVVNIANMAFGELTGVADAMTDVLGGAAQEAIETGLAGMDDMLDTQLHEFFQKPFDDIVDPVVNALYNALESDFDADNKTWGAGPAFIVNQHTFGLPSSLYSTLHGELIGLNPTEKGVLNEAFEKLDDLYDALGEVAAILDDSGGGRTIVGDLIKGIVGELAAEFVSAIVDDKLNAYLEDLDPSLDRIYEVVSVLRTEVAALRDALETDFGEELRNQVIGMGPELTAVVSDVETDVTAFFNGIDVNIDNPFVDYPEAQVKAIIRQSVEDRFFESTVASSLQVILKQRLYDLDASIREGIDSMFQQMNLVMRDLINASLAEVDNSFSSFLGGAADVMGAAKINGYAHINGDSLKLLRLDIYALFQIPDEMEFNAFLQIKELDSEGTPTECLPDSGKATEVSAGATDVKIKWISPDLIASVMGKFTFDSGADPALINMGGGFELAGALSFEAFEISYLGAAMAFGELENYFSAAARVKVNSYEGAGGIMFGKVCSLDAFFWDPDVQSIVGDPPFAGAYMYGEVWLPLGEVLLGIPSSCFFDLSAGVGAGAGFFVEGPTFIGKMLLGVSGEVLCLVHVGGQVKLVAVKEGISDASGLRMKGTGTVFGEIGICPFCIDFEKSLGITYEDMDYDVDF